MSAPSQADILAALQSQSQASRRSPPNTVSHAALADTALDSLTNSSGQARTNSRKLYCPREGCSCVVIGVDAATWVEAESDLLPTEAGSPFSPTGPAYWHVAGSPFAFDNIGFSKPDTATVLPANLPGFSEGKRVKWLICAECDLGPIGWSFEGGNEAWLAVDRLRYSA